MDKRYDHQSAQEHARKRWEQENTYAPANNSGPLYSIDTPPPTVSGALHIGHIFSYTQTDIIARYQRMNGKSVFYPFGFDDNGLPTERYIEKKLKIRAHELPRTEFIKLCLQETVEVEEQFKNLWQRMGLSADWSSCYATISESSRRISQESFIRLFKDGHVYRRYEPALYCTACRTSVAQAELESVDKPSQFNDVVFTTEDGTQLLIGTTRPELLSSCVALIFHPDDTRYHHLRGKQAVVPLFGHTVPILEDPAVEQDKGTGLVMCCTFGDKTDVVWYKKFKLPYKQSIGLDGKWTPETGPLAGLRAPAARTKVIEELLAKDLLLNQKPISHAVNVHERCKKEIEYVALSQWFLTILEHKKTFLQLADKINWHPHYMKARYLDWVENLGWDWCLSRQRFYGIPFPAWHCQDCDEILLADIKDLPIDPQETAFPGDSCTKCKSTNIVPDTDVMDTWNTSSLSPYICYGLYTNDTAVFDNNITKDFLPMGMRPQAHDIIRTWAFYTIVKTWFHHKSIPWHDIVISGHVLSGDKEKLSKSKENAPFAPENLLKRYPADVIRYWTATGSLGTDILFSETQLKIGQKLVTKLWNAFRFVKEHIAQAPTEQPQQLGALNEWLLHNASTTFATYQKQFGQYEFGLALNHIETFFWHNFCDTYLELVKDQLFNPDKYDKETVAATRWTLHHVGLRILQWYAPYVPYVTETIHDLVYTQDASLHQTKFADTQQAFSYPESVARMTVVLDTIAHVRKLKTTHQLSLKVEITTLTIHGSGDQLDALKTHENLIKGVTWAQEIKYTQETLAQSSLHQENNTITIAVKL